MTRTVHASRTHSPRARRPAGVLAVAAALAAISGCQGAAQRLTVPISSWPGYEYFRLARDQGLDTREQLALKLIDYPDPQDIVHAYLRGELAVAQLTTVEAVDLCARVPKRCPVVVLILDESLGADQVVARPEIRDIAALRNRPVAVTPSTLGPYVLSRALETKGLGLDDVQIRPMPLAAMADSLQRGEVVGAALFPPFSDAALRGGLARPLFSSRQIPGEILDVLVVEPTLLAAKPDQVARLLRVWERAHRYAERNPKDAVTRMAQWERVSAEAFRQALRGLGFRTLAQQRPLFQAGGPLERNLQAVQRVQIGLGLLDRAPLPRVDGRPLERALSGSPLRP